MYIYAHILCFPADEAEDSVALRFPPCVFVVSLLKSRTYLVRL